jgi:hypothetical protein
MKIGLIIAAAIGVATDVAYAQQRTPNPQKLEACRRLAMDRGFTFDRGSNKGAVKAKDFVQGCMRGTQR